MAQVLLPRGRDGFTLVEVLVAVVIMMVGMLGLLQAVNVAIEHNLRNQLRDEAVHLGEKYMNNLKGLGFDNIPVGTTTTTTVQSGIRGGNRSYTVETKATTFASNSAMQPTTKQLEVTVKWTYRNVGYQNRVVAPISIIR